MGTKEGCFLVNDMADSRDLLSGFHCSARELLEQQGRRARELLITFLLLAFATEIALQLFVLKQAHKISRQQYFGTYWKICHE